MQIKLIPYHILSFFEPYLSLLKKTQTSLVGVKENIPKDILPLDLVTAAAERCSAGSLMARSGQ